MLEPDREAENVVHRLDGHTHDKWQGSKIVSHASCPKCPSGAYTTFVDIHYLDPSESPFILATGNKLAKKFVCNPA